MLPGQAHLELEYIGKRGWNDFDYENTGLGPEPGLPSGLFVLRNDGNERYDAARVTIRYPFRRSSMLVVSYTRSRDHSTAPLTPTPENPLFTPQSGGPVPWDAPNRLLSSGWVPVGPFPLVGKFLLAYALDWRTGYPYNGVNQNQQLVAAPDSYRFPDFLSLNLSLEKTIRLFGFEWAIRGGFDNITDQKNPTVVINNADSPLFRTFTDINPRSFVARIRLLGRK
jgi:hypothetical protein